MIAWLLVLAQEDPAPGEAAADEVQGPVLEGELTVGLRLLDVDGSQAQYDEDVNLESGLFVRGFGLRLRELEDLPLESLELRAEGIGEPFSSYRLEALGGPWRTIGRFDTSQYLGNAEADKHSFDVERETGSLGFEYRPRNSPTRSSLELEYLHRDGVSLGTRSVGFEFVGGFPRHTEETSYGARGDFATEFAGWGLELGLGLRTLTASDRLTFDEPSTTFPGSDWSEDFDADTDGLETDGKLRLERELGDDGARADLGFGWRRNVLEGDLLAFETGFLFDPTLPFERTTRGDLELTGRELEAQAGLSFPISEAADLDLRYTRELEEQDGDLQRAIALDELMGDPPTLFEFLDVSDHDSALDLFQLDLSLRPHERVGVDLALEYGREQIDVQQVVEDVVIRRFDGTVDELGGQGKLSLELGSGVALDLAGGHVRQPTETPQVGVEFVFEDDRTSFASLGCRWRGKSCTVSGDVRAEHRESEAFRSEGDFGTYGLAFSGALGEGWTLGANLALQDYDLEARTTFLFFDPVNGIQEVPALAAFAGQELAFGGSLQVEATERITPRLSWSAALSSGDSEFTFATVRADLPCQLAPGFELGLATAYHDFDGDGLLDSSDYDALLLELYLRKAFGPHRL